MNELDFALDTKALDDTGHIEGVAAGYGNVDFGGDVMLPGSIAKSLEGRKAVPMLMYHDMRKPVGVWNDFKESGEGLIVKGKFAMSTRFGKEAFGLVKDGAIGGLSIGFGDVKAKMVGKVRHIASAFLHEISLVTIPMNAKAQILGVKELEDIINKLRAGEQLQEREWEQLFKKQFDLSNAEAERAVRINLKGRGELGSTADAISFAERLRTAALS